MEYTEKQVWRLLIPLILEQILLSLMGTADTLMVSNAGGEAVSAVSLVNTLNTLVIEVFSAMAASGTVLVSQYLGREDQGEAREHAAQLLISIALIAGLFGLLCGVFRRPLLTLCYGAVEPGVMAEARDYLLITAISFPLLAIYSAGASIFRSCGNSRLPMIVSVIGNVLNVAGNAILIFGFHFRALGVAIPTLISRGFCAITLLICLRHPENRICIRNLLKTRLSLKRIKRILSLAIPNGIENSTFQLGKLITATVVSGMGTVAISANAIVQVMEGFSSKAGCGIGIGLMTVVGTCIGANKKDEARYWIRRLTFYSFLMVGVSSLICILFAKPLTRLAGLVPEAAALAVSMSIFVHVVKPFAWPLAFTPVCGMRGAGDVRFSMIVSTATMWLFRVGFVVLLAKITNLGPMGVWIGVAADWAIRSIIFFIRFRSMKWADRDVLK